MSEEIPPSPDEKETAGILDVSLQSLQSLLSSTDDAISNSIRRVTEDARNKENYAAFGNAP